MKETLGSLVVHADCTHSPRVDQEGQQEHQAVSPACAGKAPGRRQQERVETEKSPAAVCPVPIGTRVFCDAGISLEGGQRKLDEAFALLSLSLYLGWVHILIMLCVASLFSSTARCLCIGEHPKSLGQLMLVTGLHSHQPAPRPHTL